MGGFLVIVGLIVAIVAIVCLIRPIRAIGISSRVRAFVLFAVGVLIFGIGVSHLPTPEPSHTQLAEKSAPKPATPPLVPSTTTAQSVAPAQPAIQSAPKPEQSAAATPPPASIIPAQPVAPAEPTPMAKAVAAIALKPSWERIELEEKDSSDLTLMLSYKPSVVITTLSTVEADTKQIARAVLAEMVKQGRKPAEERVRLSVFGRQSTRGETGKELVRLFGFTSYDYRIDQLEFTPMGK